MKQATKAITDILTARGCKPAATVNRDGETIIKVNAPPVPTSDPAPLNFNDPWVAFFEPD